jgi:acyl-CoA synthetase (NDP forming)
METTHPRETATTPTAAEAVEALLNPRSVALVGASADLEKFSGQPLKNLLNAEFAGEVYPINRRGGDISGVPVLTDVSELPFGVDVGLVMVPASGAIEAVGALGDRGVKTAVVAVSGFAELGTAEGTRLQEELQQAGVKHNIRLVGPNTNGIYNTAVGFPLGYNYVHSLKLAPGSVGLISHSGAMLGGFLPLLEAHGQGISTFVSCGNEVDLSLSDYARYLLDDSSTTVIALILDGIEDGVEFRKMAAEAARRGKAIVALKLGNSASGTQATQAHSSRLAGSAAAYEAVFAAEGIVSVPTLETLALACAILADGRRPSRPGVIATSTSGAGSIMTADVFTAAGLEPPQLAPETAAAVAPFAGFAQVINPFDNGAAGGPNASGALTALANDPAAGFFLSYLNPVPTLSWRKALATATAEVAQQHPAMPVVVSSPAPLLPEEAEIYRQARIPVVSSTLDVVSVFSALATCIPADARQQNVPSPAEDAPTSEQAGTGSALSEPDSKALLSKFGISFPVEVLASSADEVLEAGRAAGFPVVLKGAGTSLTHKTEHNLVSVGVDESSIRGEFERLATAARSIDPDGYQGVIVAQQIGEGVEVVLGVTVDADFGPMVLVGSGGILTEILDDVAIAPVPLDYAQAGALLARTKVDRLITGYRGSLPKDRDAVIRQIVALSDAAVSLADRIVAIDLNPVRVLDSGAVALDALVIEA